MKKRKNTSKRQGNTFENKIARKLGQWWFNDKHALCRHQTSGAQKVAWIGDIVPQKQIPWKTFPFYIECKNGYQQHIPNLLTQTQMKKWLLQYLNELNSDQYILLFISCFKNQRTMLTCLTPFDGVEWNSAIQVRNGNKYIIFYNYDFNKLLKTDFYEITKNWELNLFER